MFELFCRQYTLGYAGLTILYRNFSSPRVIKLKDKINSSTLNYITCESTRSEEETWVRRAFRVFWFCKKRAHVKTRQIHSLKNVNCVVNALCMWCARSGTPFECFYIWNMWNANILPLFSLNMKLYMFMKFFPRLNCRETIGFF